MNRFLLLTLSAILLASTACQPAADPLWPLVASDTLTIQASGSLSGPCPGNNAGMITFDRLIVGSNVVAFTLPQNKVLVVTSFDWQATGTAQSANRSRTASLYRSIGGVNGPSAQSTALADHNGKAGGAEVFPTGLVLKNPAKLCIQMDQPTSGETVIGVVNGFLAPDN